MKELTTLTLSLRKPLSYRNHSIDLQSKSMDWLLHDNGLYHERVKYILQALEAVVQEFSSKTVFLKFSQISLENTSV